MHRTVKYSQKKLDRLNHIEGIFQSTMGWTVQLMNLYEERKRLLLEVSRMEPKDGGDNSNTFKRAQNSYRRSNLGPTKVR